MDKRLGDYEDRSSKKFNDLDSKMGVMNNLLENHKRFLEELTDKKTKTSEEKVKNLFEKVYSQDTVCREEREENTEKFDQLQLVMNSIEKKFETEVGNVLSYDWCPHRANHSARLLVQSLQLRCDWL